MKPLRIAVIGLHHGATHIKNILDHPRAVLSAVVDLDGERLSETREEYSVRGFGSAQEMAQSGVADAAIIAVPTACHTTTSETCLKNGLHVLLEKPLCRTDEEAARIGA